MNTYTLKNEQDRYGDHNSKCWYICKVEKKYVPQSSLCTKVYLEKWFAPPSIHLEKVPAPSIYIERLCSRRMEWSVQLL